MVITHEPIKGMEDINNYGRGSYRDQTYNRGRSRSFERQNRSRRNDRSGSNSKSGHIFEIYTLVSEIHENVDLVLGIKNMFELEGVISL